MYYNLEGEGAAGAVGAVESLYIHVVNLCLQNKAAFDRVFDLVNQSPVIGMELCCGTFLEGGDKSFPLLGPKGVLEVFLSFFSLEVVD